MRNKVYVKEGVGFEGITMMHSGKSNAPKLFRFLAVLLIVLGLLGFVIAGIMQANKEPVSEKPIAVVLPTSGRDENEVLEEISVTPDTTMPTVSATPTKSLTPTIGSTITQKKPGLTVAVLNGSGTKGAAKVLSTALAEAGYVVERTGNADAFTYEGITVQIKKSKQQNLDQLKKDLSANDVLVSKSTADLVETEDVDVIIIVGTE